jgi:DNA-binding PadR family transcriptional regulator
MVDAILLTVVRLRPTVSVTDASMTNIAPLTPPVFHILLALAREERHGYAIMQDVEQQTEGSLQLGPGTLYGCIKRMLAAGLIEESGERPDPGIGDERRRYYRITPAGTRAAKAEARRMATALAAAKSKRVFAGGKI